MPLIQVTMIEGRSAEKKKAFYEQVTAIAAKTLDVKPAQVRVVINEVQAEHWVIGGMSKADLDAEKTAS